MSVSRKSRPPAALLSAKVLFFVTVATLILPSYAIKTQRVRYIRNYLRIQTPKTDPPRIAFLDVMLMRNPVSKTTEGAAINLNQIIAEKKLAPAAQSFKYRRVAIPTMTVRSNNYVYNTQTQTYDQDWMQNLSPRERDRILVAGIHQEDMDFSNIEDPLKKALHEKVQQEIRNVRSAVPSGWVISGSATTGSNSHADPLPDKANPDNSSSSENDVAFSSQEQGARSLKGNFRITGHLALDSTTPYLPGDRFEIHWVRENVSRKTGDFFPQKDWSYAIDVSEMVGAVRVNLYDSYGSLKAMGELTLTPDLSAQQRQNSIIQLRAQNRFSANFKYFYPGKRSWGNGAVKSKIPIDDQTSFVPTKDGQLSLEGVSPRSSAFAYSEGREFYPAIHQIQTGNQQSLMMMPRRWVKALQQIAEDQKGYSSMTPHNGAVIIGQATSKGKPLAGVRVEIENDLSAKPIYLNALFLPDPALQATSDNGYFVFLDLPQAYYSIQGYLGPQFFGFGNVLNEPDAVSFAEIVGNLSKAPFEVRAFDAFTSEEKAGELHLQSLGDQVIHIQGYGLLDVPQSSQLTLSWFEPEDHSYVSSLYVSPPASQFLHAPLVRADWIESLQRTKGIVPQAETGRVIGFVQKGNYQVSMPHVDEQSDARIVYFDPSGQLSETPVAEGGFAVFNLPPSGQTVVLHYSDGSTDSHIIPVDSSQTTIVRFLP